MTKRRRLNRKIGLLLLKDGSRFDIVVAQFHDQDHTPGKYMGLEKGMNITPGQRFVRTGPDHGTACDTAGQGMGNSSSLEIALGYANRLVTSKLKDAAYGTALYFHADTE